jgi:hypothetical protein
MVIVMVTLRTMLGVGQICEGDVDCDALIGLIGRDVLIVMSSMIIVMAMLLITIVRLIWIYLWFF